jgi:quercetin dioxygenase-like cupin family protein
MNVVGKTIITAGVMACLAQYAFSQDQAKAGVTTMAGSKFAAVPGVPACMKISAQRGDPSKGSAVLLLKATPGCTVPWHWHTANENLMMVSGRGKLEMKDVAATIVGPGDYVYLPSQHPHQFTCSTSCTVFDVTDAAFDIHYIDKDGKEIPPEQALKPPAQKSAPKKK